MSRLLRIAPQELEGGEGFNTFQAPPFLFLPRGNDLSPPPQDAAFEGMLPLLQQLLPPMPSPPPSSHTSSSPSVSVLPSRQRSQLQLAHAVLHSAAQSHAAAVAQHQAQAKLIAVVQELISSTLSGEGEGEGFNSELGGREQRVSSSPLQGEEGLNGAPLPAHVETPETQELFHHLSVLEALEKSTQENLTSNQSLLDATMSSSINNQA